MSSTHQPWLATYKELGIDWQRVPELPALTLSDYVRKNARDFADREALVYLGKGIAYAELDQLADRTASLLVSLGCKAGDVLGCHLPNTPQYVLGLIAAARIGMVTTSLSPLMTPQELAYQSRDAKLKVLFTLDAFPLDKVGALREHVPSLAAVVLASVTEFLPGAPKAKPAASSVGDVQVLGLSDGLERMAGTPPPAVSVSLDDVLYLMYTGGTTGMPKGARLSSRNLFTNNLQCDAFYGYRVGEEIIASAFPLFHIGGMTVLLNALRTAATFVLAPNPRDIEHFCKEMQARPPTVLAAVPALFQMLLASETFRSLDFSNLRTAISGASPFAEAELRRLEAVIGTGKFAEVYGMTETSPVQTLNPPKRLKPGFVGIPVPGTEVRIVDGQTLEQLPLGEVGEIIASGPQVMAGYLGLSDATATALRQIDGRTWMFTGDVGYLDDEGYLKICDRSKDMLIVGGYKVFSAEVETKLRALPFIAMTAVVGRPDPARPGNDIVQLYVQRMPGDAAPTAEREAEILAFCRENMSPYKVPKEVFFLDALPLTSVGKIDKKVLRRPAEEAAQGKTA